MFNMSPTIPSLSLYRAISRRRGNVGTHTPDGPRTAAGEMVVYYPTRAADLKHEHS